MSDPSLRMGAAHPAASTGNVTAVGFPSDASPVALFFALLLSFVVILCAVSMINALGRPLEPRRRGIAMEDGL